MPANKAFFASCFFFLLSSVAGAQTDVLEPGVKTFMRGDLDGAITFFGARLKKNSSDLRAGEMLGNCLVIKGKSLLKGGKREAGIAFLARAEKFLPEREDLKTLRLLAELDKEVPVEAMAVSTPALESPLEMWAVFDCVFGVGKCASFARDLIHVVGPGETMSAIADKYYGDYKMWEKIWEANPRLPNPHRLEKGTVLIIPQP